MVVGSVRNNGTGIWNNITIELDNRKYRNNAHMRFISFLENSASKLDESYRSAEYFMVISYIIAVERRLNVRIFLMTWTFCFQKCRLEIQWNLHETYLIGTNNNVLNDVIPDTVNICGMETVPVCSKFAPWNLYTHFTRVKQRLFHLSWCEQRYFFFNFSFVLNRWS